MMQLFTTEELLQYVYHETSPEKTAAIEAAIQNDWSLREKLDLLKTTHQQLDEVRMSPRKQTIDFILQYAEKSVEELTAEA